MSKPVLAAIVFVVVVLGIIIYTSISLGRRIRGEVCMEFNGQTACKTVSGDTREHVLQTAVSNACADIASGVTDTINCEHSPPKSVVWK
jgi:hypothetical protein